MQEKPTISILGLGLMGASLGLALKQRGYAGTVRGYARREETRRAALERGVADEIFSSPEEAVTGADIVVACVPIWTIARLIEQVLPALKPGAVVTDVGSTKSELIRSTEKLFRESEADFVGSHPVAGSEKTGIEAGDANLYRNRLCIICPPQKCRPEAVDAVTALWKFVGSETLEMSPEQHDALLASTSHLPHMVAAALARSVAGSTPEEKAPFCGTGFKDTTRVASGSPDMWVDIIDTNRKALAEELTRFHAELTGLMEILRQGNSQDIREWLVQAADARNAILQANPFLKS
jgi:prephenate dehydrogenase